MPRVFVNQPASTGAHDVRTQRRQIQISPGTEAEDRSAASEPSIDEALDRGASAGNLGIRFEAKGGVGMTTLGVVPSIVATIPSPLKKKRVLLVDASSAKRDMRAETMRKLGMDVDCAADISEARSWWRAALYNLVLFNVESEMGRRDKFCEDIRSATPPQQLAFLVGKPDYLADLPNADSEPSVQPDADPGRWGDVRAALSADLPEGLPQRWGILEASRRISAVRSQSHARSQAMRERPAPARDLETRDSKRTAAWSQLLPELQKEEMQ